MESWSEIVFDVLFTERNRVKPVCDVCGRQVPVRVACSAYGPISFGYCEDCLSKNLEPYSAVVAYIACAGRFPDEINEAYQHDVRRMLPLWNKTEEEFIRDVDAAIKEMEGCE